jgi:hypothetical protein
MRKALKDMNSWVTPNLPYFLTTLNEVKGQIRILNLQLELFLGPFPRFFWTTIFFPKSSEF